MYLNYLSNYVPNAWNYEHGCGHCEDDILDLSQLKVGASYLAFSIHLPSLLAHFKTAAVESLCLVFFFHVDIGKDEA